MSHRMNMGDIWVTKYVTDYSQMDRTWVTGLVSDESNMGHGFGYRWVRYR